MRPHGGAPFLGNFFSLYVSGAWLLGKTDFSPTKRGGFVCGFGTYRGRGCLEKRIFPLLNVEASCVGLVRIGGGGASTVRDRRSYAWVATGGGFLGLRIRGVVASTVGDRRSYAWVATGGEFLGLRIRGVVASTVGDRRSYAWVATGDGFLGLRIRGVVASTVGDRRSYAWVATVKGYYVLLILPSRQQRCRAKPETKRFFLSFFI